MTDKPQLITVKQLIEILQKYDSDLPVLTDGYEGGFESTLGIRIKKIYYRGNDPYLGDYDDAIWSDHGDETIEALIIGFRD